MSCEPNECCETTNNYINKCDDIINYAKSIDCAMYKTTALAYICNLLNYCCTTYPSLKFPLETIISHCCDLFAYLGNIKQYILNFCNDIFQSKLCTQKYNMYGEFSSSCIENGKFKILLKHQNPFCLVNNDCIYIGKDNYVTGTIDVYIKYIAMSDDCCIIEQKETHKYKYCENYDNNICDNDEKCLELVDCESEEVKECDDSTRVMCDAQLCIQNICDKIKLYVTGEIQGELDEKYCDTVKVCCVVELKIVKLDCPVTKCEDPCEDPCEPCEPCEDPCEESCEDPCNTPV